MIIVCTLGWAALCTGDWLHTLRPSCNQSSLSAPSWAASPGTARFSGLGFELFQSSVLPSRQLFSSGVWPRTGWHRLVQGRAGQPVMFLPRSCFYSLMCPRNLLLCLLPTLTSCSVVYRWCNLGPHSPKMNTCGDQALDYSEKNGCSRGYRLL